MTKPVILHIENLGKTYADGFTALEKVDLDIYEGEVFALLGPNGAGKTTLIGTICGLLNITEGHATVGGHDVITDYRKARSLIGLVPQEIFLDPFLSVYETLQFARGYFGKPHNPELLESILKDLSLWDKKDNRVIQLSGGMKRRVLIAKALTNEPKLLFLDEPTAGVDVELRKDMWRVVQQLKEAGTTIILTTHYIEEAEQMADRVGVINNGTLELVEEKDALMKRMGSKKLLIYLCNELSKIPNNLSEYNLQISKNKKTLSYEYDANKKTGITKLINGLKDAGIEFTDLKTEQSSLEEIFVQLVKK